MNTILTHLNTLLKEIVDDFETTNPGWLSNYFLAEQVFQNQKLIVFTDTYTSMYEFNFTDNLGNYFYIRSLDGFINYNQDQSQYISCTKNYDISTNLRLVMVFDRNYSPFLVEKKIRKILSNNNSVYINKFTWNKNLIAIEETTTTSLIKDNINIIAFDFTYKVNDELYNDRFQSDEINCAIELCQNCSSSLFKFKDKLNLPTDII